MTKSGRAHTVPLSTAAAEIIGEIPRIGDSDLVFTTNDRTRTPISGFSKAKGSLDRRSKVSDWRFHDLRATMATRMEAQLNIPPHMVGALLNHDPKSYKGITSVYTRGDPADAKRSAMEAWGSLLGRIVAAVDRDNIVELGASEG